MERKNSKRMRNIIQLFKLQSNENMGKPGVFIKKYIPVLAVCLVSIISFWGVWPVPAAAFRLNTPTEDHVEPAPLEIEGAASPRNHESAFARVIKFATSIGNERNYYELGAVVDTNKLLLDSGDIVTLVGLVSSAEIAEYRRVAGTAHMMRYSSEMVIDFMDAYLSDKKMKVRFARDLGSDEHGHPFAYVSVVDDALFNEVLVRYGYGMVSSAYYFPEYGSFNILQEDAQYGQVGIWRNLART